MVVGSQAWALQTRDGQGEKPTCRGPVEDPATTARLFLPLRKLACKLAVFPTSPVARFGKFPAPLSLFASPGDAVKVFSASSSATHQKAAHRRCWNSVASAMPSADKSRTG